MSEPVADVIRTPVGRVLSYDPNDHRREDVSYGLTPAKARAALRAADDGDLSQALDLFEELEDKDIRLQSVLNTRRNALTGMEWEIVSAAEYEKGRVDKLLAEDAATFVRDRLTVMERFEQSLVDLSLAIGPGLAVLEMIWDGNRLMDIDAVPVSRLFIDFQRSKAVRIRKEAADTVGFRAAPPNFVLHMPHAKHGLPLRGSLMRAVLLIYLIRNYAIKDWATFSEVFGMPVRIARYEPNATAEEKTDMLRMLQMLGTDAVAIFSRAIDLEIKETGDRRGAPYAEMVNWAAREMAIGVLGQNLTTDTTGAAEVVRQFHAQGVDLVFDYEHQTLGAEYSAPDGRARAAGWITALSYEPGRGLFCDVRWNDEAENLIAGFEYRYFSPVVIVRKDDKRMVGLHSVALTNKPAIRHARPIVAMAHSDGTLTGEYIMDDQPTQGQVPGGGTGGDGEKPGTLEDLVAAIRAALGIEEGDAVAVLQAALAKLKGAEAPEEAVPASVARALTLSDGAGVADAVAAIEKIATPSGDQSEMVALKERVTALTGQVATERKARQSLEADRVVNAEEHKGKMAASEVALHVNRLKEADDFNAAVADFSALMATRPVALKQAPLPKFEGGAGGGDRQTVINAANREFDNEPGLRVTGRDTYVNGALRDAGLSLLNEEEKGKLVTA